MIINIFEKINDVLCVYVFQARNFFLEVGIQTSYSPLDKASTRGIFMIGNISLNFCISTEVLQYS